MSSFNAKQVRGLSQAILRLQAAVSLNELPQAIFEAMRLVVPYEVAGVPQVERRGDIHDVHFSEPEAHELLARGSPELVPSLYALPGMCDGRFFAYGPPISLHRFVSHRQFEETVFFQSFYRPLGLSYETTLNFDGDARTVYQVSLARRRPFTEAECARLDLVQPHLRQRFRQLLALEPNHPLFAPVLPGRKPSWLHCTSQGQILAFSAEVPALFARMGWSWRSLLPEEWVAWLQEYRQPFELERGPKPPLRFSGLQAEVLVQCVVSSPRGQHRLLLLERPRSGALLSPREAEVAGWVAEGKTNAVIADLLGISPATVKNHIVAILTKIGGENRAAIATYHWQTRSGAR